jgi:molybdate transport system regulatory protein
MSITKSILKVKLNFLNLPIFVQKEPVLRHSCVIIFINPGRGINEIFVLKGMISFMYNLKYKIWLDNNGVIFGTGPYTLLKGVEEKGSLAGAAKAMNMSYNKAHNLIKKIEARLGFQLLDSKPGGAGGGISQLTAEAESLMSVYEQFYNECKESLNIIFEKYFSDLPPLPGKHKTG